MIELHTPRGLPVSVPEALQEDPTPRFEPSDVAKIAEYYDAHGYVVVAGVVSAEDCDTIRGLWEAEVKPSKQFIYRQATAKAEQHQYNLNGWVMNPILNLQSVDPRSFGKFRRYATSNILSHPKIANILRELLDDTPKIVQSMYFEGNSATWEHQDSYYLDSENVGMMAAAWIAIEDIEAKAGRFFICPGSHKMQVAEQTIENNIADNHEEYIQSVVAKIREDGLEVHAPVLRKGDVLFWNAWTIHGSLDSQDPRYSRSSITCHAIPARDRFYQLQLRLHTLATDTVNGVEIFRPKDLRLQKSRAMLWFESRWSRQFYWLKRNAIKALMRRKMSGSRREGVA
jgi:phytanoyl-CoA hydroxylase